MSQIDDVVVPLLGARIFSGLAPAQLKALALEAEVITFKRGETLIKAYQEGDGAFLIGSGAVIEEPEVVLRQTGDEISILVDDGYWNQNIFERLGDDVGIFSLGHQQGRAQ